MAVIKPTMPLSTVLGYARQALHMSQREFGPALGVSHRTASRWDTGGSTPGESELRMLAKLLVPVDLDLATDVAAHIGETLEHLGLVAPPPPPPVVTAPPLPPSDLVDIVVCAVAESTDSSPRALRPMLLVAFRRARELGLTVEQVEKALGAAKKK